MREKLLDRALRRVQESNDRALTRAADAEAKLAQAGDLLTALGVPLSTDPAADQRTAGYMDLMARSSPRKLTLSERIMVACGRTLPSSGADANVPSDPPGQGTVGLRQPRYRPTRRRTSALARRWPGGRSR